MPSAPALQPIVALGFARGNSVRVNLPVPRPIVRNCGPLGSPRRPRSVEIGDEVFLGVVVARHREPLAASRSRTQEAAVLRVDIADRHAEPRAD